MRRFLLSLSRLLTPNPATLAFVATGFIAEVLLLGQTQSGIYDIDRPATLFGLLFLAWFWLTLGWLVCGFGRICRRFSHERSRTSALLIWSVATSVMVLAALLYAASWGLFLRSGRFANLETGRFLLFNFTGLWTYVVEAEPITLLWTGAVVVVTGLLSPWLLRRWAVSSWPGETPRLGARWVAWLALCLLTCGCWNALPSEPSVLRQAARLHALRHSLHPTFSLYVSRLESRRDGAIRAVLDAASLTPLSAAASQPMRVHPTDAGLPSIIIVAVESLRHDTIHQVHQGQEILPHINRLARQGLHLTRAYAQSTHSDYADVCLVSSLYPLRTRWHHYYGPTDPWPRTQIYDLLEPHGYATAIISSQNEHWGGMDHFLNRPSLQYFYHPETSDQATVLSDMDSGFAREVRLGGLVAGKFPDDHTTDVTIDWITRQVRADRPFFVSMNFQSSHFPYLLPDSVPRPFHPCELDPRISFVNYPQSQTARVRNAYFNAIHECDRQVGRLVAALQRLGRLENTILIVTGENGEAFHECGSITHAREPVEPAIHVACVIHAPRRLAPAVIDYPFEHVDLVPTILGLMGQPSHPNFQGIDILSTNRPPADQRLTFCHVITSLAEADAVILGGRWKLTHNRRDDTFTLHDVLTDPQQTTDQTAFQPDLAWRLRKTLQRWRDQQLAYYHFPAYYLSYYPPRPPRWSAADGKYDSDHDSSVSLPWRQQRSPTDSPSPRSCRK